MRTLPWLTGAAVKGETRNCSTVDRLPEHDGRSGQEGATRPRIRHAVSRLPSSSPPPGPAPTHSPLRPGLNADDIYIMVEDEFLATAQLFSRHLHKLEYSRLKNAARARDTSGMQEIVRPTDGATRMRKELRQSKVARSTHKRAKRGIDDMIVNAAQGRAESSESDFSEADLDQVFLWQGTELQSFIDGPNRPRSLGGLQGSASHTRAAAGFEKASKTRSFTGDLPHAEPRRTDEDDDETDDDDLDAPVRIAPPVASASSQHRKPLDRQQGERPKMTPTKVPPNPPDPTAARQRIKARQEREKEQDHIYSNDREIPLFEF